MYAITPKPQMRLRLSIIQYAGSPAARAIMPYAGTANIKAMKPFLVTRREHRSLLSSRRSLGFF